MHYPYWRLLPAVLLLAVPAEVSAENGDAKIAQDIVDIEKAFAKASLKDGLKRSFLEYAAPNSTIFRPAPVPARVTLENDPQEPRGVTLDWWPATHAWRPVMTTMETSATAIMQPSGGGRPTDAGCSRWTEREPG